MDIERPLMQEEMADKPFWMLVGCIMVNKAQWRTARPILGKLMVMHNARSLSSENIDLLANELTPLGLQHHRAHYIVWLAREWILNRPRIAADVEKLPGCGQYAADSWAIFIEGRLDVNPEDEVLKEYLRQVKR